MQQHNEITTIGGLLTGRKINKLNKLLKNEVVNLNELIRANTFWISIKVRTAIFLGIIFLMTFKPDLYISILTLCISIGAGFLPLPNKSRQAEIQKSEI